MSVSTYILVGHGFMGVRVLSVTEEYLIHLSGRVLEEFVVGGEDDQRNFTVT